MSGASTGFPWRAAWVALRPRQWLKNAVVLAAFFFTMGDLGRSVGAVEFARALAAALIFCLASGAGYLLNDLLDRDYDRHHPVKRHRPVVSGALPSRTAAGLSAALGAGALALGAVLGPPFLAWLAAYGLMQVLYSVGLKRLPLADVLIIATGFVVRAVAGGAAIGVAVTHWLLACTFLLALFLALCKRRSERELAGEGTIPARPGLARVPRPVLDVLIALVALATLAVYTAYTLAPATAVRFGSRGMIWTAPLVGLGLLRYLHLVFRRGDGEAPEEVLWTDRIMWAVLGTYAVTVILTFVIR